MWLLSLFWQYKDVEMFTNSLLFVFVISFLDSRFFFLNIWIRHICLSSLTTAHKKLYKVHC